MNITICVSRRRGLLPGLLVVLLAGCEGDTAQLVQEIEAAREGCTNEMLEAGAEECVQMFEKYIEMGTGAIDTYIGALRTFDAAVDRGPELRFDTAGLGHAISPELVPAADGSSAARLRSLSTSDGSGPFYARQAPYSPSVDAAYPPASGAPANAAPAEELPSRSPTAGDGFAPSTGSDSRRPPAPVESSTPRRGAILPPAERLNRPWIGDAEQRNDYYPDAASTRDDLKRQATDPKAGRATPSERPAL